MPSGNFKPRQMQRPELRRGLILGLLFVLCTSLCSQSLENKIYDQIDRLAAAPSTQMLEQLQPKVVDWNQEVSTAREHMALVILQSTMGYHFNRLNQTADAITNYQAAWQRFEQQQLKGYDIVEYCLKPLGVLYIKTGAFSQAENTIKSYIFLAQKQGNQKVELGGIINLSVLYHNTGNYRTAVNLLQQGLQQQGVSEEQRKKLENNLATNLIALQEYEQASVLIKKALTAEKDINTFKNAAQIALQNTEYKSAETYLKQAQLLLAKDSLATSRDVAKIYVEQGQLFALQNKTNNAFNNYQRALQTLLPLHSPEAFPVRTDVYAENTFLDVFDGLAALSEEQAARLKYLNLGIEVGKKLWQNLPDQQAKILHQSNQHRRYERMLDILYRSYETDAQVTTIKDAFRISESSKAAVLTSMLSQQNLRTRYPNDDDLKKEAMLQQKQELYINQLNKKQRLGDDTEDIIYELNNIQLALKSVQQSISQRYAERKEPAFSTDELQQKLTNESAQMIHYFFGSDHLYIFHISGKTMEWKRQRIDIRFTETLQAFIGYFDLPNLINDDPIQFSAVAYELQQLLNLEMLSEETNVQLTPDGLLYFVPFDALQTTKSEVFEYAQMPFLAQQYNIGYQTSASLYLKNSNPTTEATTLGMFPVFESTDRSLPYSLEEATFVSDAVPTSLFKTENATKATFLSNANNYNILHISTHASGGDFLVPAHIEFIDQTLQLPELYALSMQPQLVVLSACETGIGRVQKGEGAMSLARGFQYAGSKNLLFTLWQVNDQTTSRWMQLFYNEVAANGQPYIAQHKAKMAYLSDASISNTKKSPYYWSAFTYFGSTQPLFEPSTTHWGTVVIGVLVILIILIVLLWYLKPKQPST